MQFIKGINDFELLMVHVILFFSRWNNFNKNPTALKKTLTGFINLNLWWIFNKVHSPKMIKTTL